MSALDRVVDALRPFGDVARDVPLARHTTFGIGGPADVYVTVTSSEALAGAARIAREAGLGPFILGSGSNILVADRGIRGVVIDNRARRETHDGEGGRVRVESGASFAGFARKMCREGLGGLTWAVGIPGTLGGAVVYNAGAYGGCLADVLERVELLEESGETAWHDAHELGLVYRGSVFTREVVARKVVLRVDLTLVPGEAAALLAEAAAYDRRRLDAQPRGRSAGSMFKNPADSPAWKLIDSVGLRGARAGDAAISDKHCNFFVNTGHARASDVAGLVEEAERRVLEHYGVQLVREVAFVGDW